MSKRPTLLVMAGGSGEHIFPEIIAVAKKSLTPKEGIDNV